MTNTFLTAPVVHQAGAGDHVVQMRVCITVKLPASSAEDGRVSAAEFWPAQFGPPLHIHHAEDEILQILEGTVRLVCGETDSIVGPGGFAYLPRGVPHTFWVQGETPARMLAIFTPGGIEKLFVDSGVPTDTEQLPEGQGTAPGAVEVLTARYDVEHIGPPLGA